MCGIFGMIGKVPEDKSKEMFTLLRNIFILTQSRGTHASGFAAVFHDGPELLTDKRPIEASKFVKRSGKFLSLQSRTPAALIGHCRLSTSGKPEIGRNNHPFISRHQAIVHNGKIDEWQKVAKELDVQLRTQTDSEIIIKIADRYIDPLDSIKNIVEGTNDAPMALAILQHSIPSSRRVILYRNKERPLYVIRSKVLNSIIFSSTPEIIVNACKMTWKFTAEEIAKNLGIEDDELTEYTALVLTLDESGQPIVSEQAVIKKTPKPIPPTPPLVTTTRPVSRQEIPDITIGELQTAMRNVEAEMAARAAAMDAVALATSPGPTVSYDAFVPVPIPPAVPPPLPDSVIKEAAQVRFEELKLAAEQTINILRLARDTPWMTAVELAHWRQFRTKVAE